MTQMRKQMRERTTMTKKTKTTRTMIQSFIGCS
ncbi:hypothetical protein CGCSCA5_v013404 [Colletotrichum siamense]|nr:hypothetical protein CGCSCA5_v013404 [Colletotrichum siamense]